MENKKLGRVGVIGRFKPLHLGARAMLEATCEQADHVFIGIGSSNKYNVRNPFTPKETKDMINFALSDRFSNYTIIYVPDFAHVEEYKDGQKWKSYVLDRFGPLDYFITSNGYVKELLEEDYSVIHPVGIIPEEKQIPLRAAEVRFKMATFSDWQSLVPDEIGDYLESNDLVSRFRSEFGLQTIEQTVNGHDYSTDESAHVEKLHVREA